MAYILYSSLGEGRHGGLVPHKKGEHCGDVSRRDIVIYSDNTAKLLIPTTALSLRLPPGCEDVVFRIGKPAKGKNLPLREKLEGPAFVGLYLTEDLPLPEDAVEIDTDVLLEEVVSLARPPQKPVVLSKIRRKEL